MQRSKLAQNRIDYIVYGNPDGVAGLIYDLGYEKPKGLQNLAKAAKLLVQKEGETMVQQLIKLHPDRGAILQVEKPQEDGYCGACGHHNYDSRAAKEDSIQDLADMEDAELERYYEKLLQKFRLNPDDENLGVEIQDTWNELRLRLQTEKQHDDEEPKKLPTKREGLLMLGLTLLAGILVGLSLKKKTYA